jgi:hypothetical protein
MAFWTLAALIEDILPPNYYSASLLGGRIDQQVFQSCLAWKLPRVYEVFRATNTMLEPVICPWFLCLYVNVIPLYVVCRIWDCLFWEGSSVLFRIGLTMVKSKAHDLAKAKDFITIYSILKNSSQSTTCSFILERAPDSVSSTATADSSQSASSVDKSSPTNSSSRSPINSSRSNSSARGSVSVSNSNGMSDGEFLMQSAFGYRWLKSIPQTKVDELRKRFLELMTASEDIREKERLEARQKSLKEAEEAAASRQLQQEMRTLPHVIASMETTVASPSDSNAASADATSTGNASDSSEKRGTDDSRMRSQRDSNDSPRRVARSRREQDMRKSQIMLRMLDTNDIATIMELAKECGSEGLDSHVEEFAREFTTFSERSSYDAEDGDDDDEDCSEDDDDRVDEEDNEQLPTTPK